MNIDANKIIEKLIQENGQLRLQNIIYETQIEELQKAEDVEEEEE